MNNYFLYVGLVLVIQLYILDIYCSRPHSEHLHLVIVLFKDILKGNKKFYGSSCDWS